MRVDTVWFRRYDQPSFPTTYHNSFWSNYYSNYWHPSSYYYNQLDNPPPLEIIPGFYQYYDPLLPKSEASANIKSRSRYYYSSMTLFPMIPM